MFDIHCHILPGIDDGAKDWEESLQMVEIASKDGISKITATPHFVLGAYETKSNKVLKLVDELNQKIKEKNINLEIFPGMEVHMDPELPNWVKNNKVLTINDEKKYMLVEFPVDSIPPYSERVFYELKLQGVIPILAHPERNAEIISNPQKIFELIEKGLLTQITAGSLLGYFGEKCKVTSEILLKRNMTHFLGSDAHNSTFRKPKLKKAYNYIKENKPNEYILLKKYADDFEKGKYLVPEEPILINDNKKSRGLFKKLRKRISKKSS